MSVFFFFKQKTAYEMRISDWSSDVCSSDLPESAASWAWQLRPTAASRKNVRKRQPRSEEHTSELQSLMRISYAVFCLKKKKLAHTHPTPHLPTSQLPTYKNKHTHPLTPQHHILPTHTNKQPTHHPHP